MYRMSEQFLSYYGIPRGEGKGGAEAYVNISDGGTMFKKSTSTLYSQEQRLSRLMRWLCWTGGTRCLPCPWVWP